MALTLLLLIADLGKAEKTKTKPRSSGQVTVAAADHKLHLQSSGCPANVIYCVFGGP